MMEPQVAIKEQFYIEHSCKKREKTIRNMFLNTNYKFYIF